VLLRTGAPVETFFINTGLEAGDLGGYGAVAVSTAFFISPLQPVAVDEFSEFLPKCAYTMMSWYAMYRAI